MKREIEKYAALSIVLGFFAMLTGLFLIGSVLGIAGIVFGNISIKKYGKHPAPIIGIILSIIGILLTISMLISLNNDNQNSTDENVVSTSTKLFPEYENNSPEAELQKYISGIIDGDFYINCEITKITINSNLGTDTTDDYIALVDITWTTKNSGPKTKEVLEMYSSNLAALVAQEQPSIQEISIFWTVPYLNNATAKWSYERKDNAMYLFDNILYPSTAFE